MKPKMIEMELSAKIDFDSMKLKKGQRAPKGWEVILITAELLPDNWDKRKAYHCTCGCNKTYRVGERWAIRNVRETGGYFELIKRERKSK